MSAADDFTREFLARLSKDASLPPLSISMATCCPQIKFSFFLKEKCCDENGWPISICREASKIL